VYNLAGEIKVASFDVISDIEENEVIATIKFHP